jgi:hypothetical protein
VTVKGQITKRVLLVVALLCAVVCAQAASLASEQFHQHSSQHCCALCHIGPLPFLQPASATYLAPVLATEWFEWSVELDTTHEVLLASGYSRAPPA